MGKFKLKNNETNVVLFEQDGIPTVRVFSKPEYASKFSDVYSDTEINKSGISKISLFTETIDRGLEEIKQINNDIYKEDIYITNDVDELKKLYVVIYNEEVDNNKKFEYIANETKMLVFDNEKAADICAKHCSSYKFECNINTLIEDKKSIKDNKVNICLFYYYDELSATVFSDNRDTYKWIYNGKDEHRKIIHGFIGEDIVSDFIIPKKEIPTYEEKDNLPTNDLYQMKYNNEYDDMMNYPRFLGIGSCFNTELGNTSCYFHIMNKLILIDCGFDVFPKIKKVIDDSKEQIKEIYVLITHLHSDHIGSLPALIEYCYYVKKININLIYPEPEKLKKCLELHLIRDNFYYLEDSKAEYHISTDMSNISIMPIKLKHDIYNMDYSYGYMFIYGNRCFIFAWDSCDVSPEVYNLFEKCINRNMSEYKISNNVEREVFLFHDVCIEDYPGNKHTNYCKMLNIFKENRDKVFFVHMDNKEELNKIAKDNGFGNIDNFYKGDK